MDLWNLSGKQKVELLGFNSEEFWQDIEKADSIIGISYLNNKEEIQQKIYPELTRLKKKYGLNFPIGIYGVDVQQLDNRLRAFLERVIWKIEASNKTATQEDIKKEVLEILKAQHYNTITEQKGV